ncbi:FtsX-like permease family protein [Rhodopirellula sp.]|nr:FtsX-like permease family protein [Rhodopirellula sp.]MDB4331513.1 FtsX-like permease family protein [bacterium]MDB4678961.1 FtsX-like permease family protein [Rhodopirellula sp.]
MRAAENLPSEQFSPLRMIIASMRHSWRISLSVALGVGVATAVIVGALLVGDSMRGSLRNLTLQRLGKIQSVLMPGHFFNPQGLVSPEYMAVPLILFERGVVEVKGDSGALKRSGNIQIIACDRSFWDLADSVDDEISSLSNDTVILNQSAAEELGVKVGELVTVRLPVEQAVPADSPLGKREAATEGLPRMRVEQIIPDKGLGRFGLSPNQVSPLNLYIDRETVAESLEREGQANVLLFDELLPEGSLRLDIANLGLAVKKVVQTFQGSDEGSVSVPVFDYYSVTSDRLLIPDVAVDQILSNWTEGQVIPQSTYLANFIERQDSQGGPLESISYSTITAVDPSTDLPLDYEMTAEQQALNRVPVVLNAWAARQLKAEVGSELEIFYFHPEVENGKEIELSFEALVTGVVPLTEPSAPYRRTRPAKFDVIPTRYNDPDLTPSVPGVTDQDSISDWDLPFKLTREISKEDDLYWSNYRLTPKLFLPLSAGKELFKSRFGTVTSLRLPATSAENPDALSDRLMTSLGPVAQELGWSIQLIREKQLASSHGTTPFDALFLSLSFFVIVSAILLIAMLFRLGLIQRMREHGLLLVLGWTPKQVMRHAIMEGLLVAVVGVFVGIFIGVAYAIFVLLALRSWWVGAVTVPFLEFHWTMRSLIGGGCLGWVVSAAALWGSARWLARSPVQNLLSQRNPDDGLKGRKSKVPSKLVVMILVLASLGLGVIGARSGGQVAAGAFVAAGMALLTAILLAFFQWLDRSKVANAESEMGLTTSLKLAFRNISRHPFRSTLTVGLMASASFLIFAIAAFQLQPNDRGTGGFDLIGQTAQPLFEDLGTQEVREQLLGPDAELMKISSLEMFRLKLGQDASCNNLYQANKPTVLGIPETFGDLILDAKLPGFQWAAGVSASAGQSYWKALDQEASGTEDDPIPIVLDQNTAMWSLQMMQGIGEKKTFEYSEGSLLTFEVVGLLSNSVLQGKILMGESNFVSAFPEVNGYQFFMVACNGGDIDAVSSVLESRLSDVGMDLSDTHRVLANMLAVQNTYLRTFQSLGALGLLLGTIGLAVAQLRSVLERQREFSVLRSLGFSVGSLGRLVFEETTILLIVGVGSGFLCAFLAVLPHAIFAEVDPPIVEPLLLTTLIIFFGMTAALVAVMKVSRLPLIDALRRELA